MLGKISNAVSTRGTRSVAKAAAARGHGYTERVAVDEVTRTVNGSDVWFDVVEVSASPRIRCGNDGHKYWVIRDDGRPGRRGFIAIEHGLDLPHVVVTSSAFGAKTPTNVVAATGQLALSIASLAADVDASTGDNPNSLFMRKAEQLDTGRRGPFKAHVAKPDASRGQALLTPEATELLAELARSFDVEVRDGWLWAHSSFGDVVTAEDDVWEWTLSSASRLVDLARHWGAGASFGQEWAGYTAERVERPRRLDGALSKRRWEK